MLRLILHLLLGLLFLLPARADRGQEEQLAARVGSQVVFVVSTRPAGVSTGTGFLVGDGLLLTALHVVRDSAEVQVRLPGDAPSARAAVVEEDAPHDLALLRFRSAGRAGTPLAVARAASLQAGEELLIVSRWSGPTGGSAPRPPTAPWLIPARFEGWGSRRDASGKSVPQLVISARIERGDSGSPVLRLRDGLVVGVLTHRESPDPDGVTETAFATPVESATPLLARAGIEPGIPFARSPAASARPPARPSGRDDFYLSEAARRAPPRPPSPSPDVRLPASRESPEFYLAPLARQGERGR